MVFVIINCVKCSKIWRIQKHVSSNALVHRRQSCQHEISCNLMKLKEKFIYLDKFSYF